MKSLRQLGVVGTTFRRAGQAGLAAYNLPVAGEAGVKPAVVALAAACHFEELVYLATCNRVEFIFVAPPGVSIAECRLRLCKHLQGKSSVDLAAVRRRAAKDLHAFAGEGAAEHLFVVAASLDSMVPGEAQILGQVKTAYRQAIDWGLAGPGLQGVFDEAFAAAKRVRQDTRLGQGAVSMLSLALGAIDARLQASPPPHRIAIVGVGDMAHQCGAAWRGRPGLSLLFVNRTVARAEALAQRYGGVAMPLATFLQRPPSFTVLVTATASPVTLFNATFFSRCGPAPWVVDLAVLRDVDPEAVRRASGMLLDIDRLKYMAQENRQARESQLAEARFVLDEMLEAFRRRLIEREMAPVTQALRARFRDTLDTSIATLFAQTLREVPPAVQADVRAWAQRLVNRLAHVPTAGLKHIGFAHGTDAVNTFLLALHENTKDKGPSA